MLSGILAIDKPLGWTSHDVVARIRRVTRQRQVGHAGTLDPLASGVLLLVLGRATRLSSYLMAQPKVYCADVVLGATTVTDDSEAPMRRHADATHITLAQVECCLGQFVGGITQIPPAYAAVKQHGEKLYVLARQGIDVIPRPREVVVDRLEIHLWEPPRLRLQVRCGSGTYIRSLARDIGAALGVGAYLHALRRAASGGVTLGECYGIETLDTAETVERRLLPLDTAVLELPAAVLSPSEVRAVQQGRAITTKHVPSGLVRLYDGRGNLVALGEPAGPPRRTEAPEGSPTGTQLPDRSLLGLSGRDASHCGGRIKPFRVFNGGLESDASGQ